jgi:hypothetical protein
VNAENKLPEPAQSLPPDIRVFVNEKGVSIARDSSALDAVRAYDATLASSVAAGQSRISDSRGLPLTPETVVNGGTILRVLTVRESIGESTP